VVLPASAREPPLLLCLLLLELLLLVGLLPLSVSGVLLLPCVPAGWPLLLKLLLLLELLLCLSPGGLVAWRGMLLLLLSIVSLLDLLVSCLLALLTPTEAAAAALLFCGPSPLPFPLMLLSASFLTLSVLFCCCRGPLPGWGCLLGLLLPPPMPTPSAAAWHSTRRRTGRSCCREELARHLCAVICFCAFLQDAGLPAAAPLSLLLHVLFISMVLHVALVQAECFGLKENQESGRRRHNQCATLRRS
jgi:hypothetical protein